MSRKIFRFLEKFLAPHWICGAFPSGAWLIYHRNPALSTTFLKKRKKFSRLFQTATYCGLLWETLPHMELCAQNAPAFCPAARSEAAAKAKHLCRIAAKIEQRSLQQNASRRRGGAPVPCGYAPPETYGAVQLTTDVLQNARTCHSEPVSQHWCGNPFSLCGGYGLPRPV